MMHMWCICLYGLHYDKEAWENFKQMSMEPKNIGICMHCKQSVKGKRGMKKEDRMWEHIFQEYFEYPYISQNFLNTLLDTNAL